MKKITAPTLQEALSQAALELACSVTELEYEVIQYDSKGVLGLFKKPAIIIASAKAATPYTNNSARDATNQHSQNLTAHTQRVKDESYNTHAQKSHNTKDEFFDASEFFMDSSHGVSSHHQADSRQSSPQQFKTKDEVLQEISEQIQELLNFMPYRISTIQVSFYDPQTLYIFLDGADSALLIGERGYRYKALSYLLFNWIQPSYGYNIRLEIAQFLQNQEEAIDAYLVGIINEVRREGKAQTKPLDGILAYIALKKLRDQLPDKYISFRQNAQNERYIVINDFYR